MRLPELIDPLQCVAKGRHWVGRLPLARLPRLVDMITNPDEAVTVDLRFERRDRVAAVTGSVRGELEVTCQRCLAPLRIAVDSPVSLGVVTSIEEGDRLPDAFEPLLLEEDRIPFSDIVEDELILAIPDIPKHAHCRPAKTSSADAGVEEAAAADNPFAALAQLKTKPDRQRG
ncbi:conserved hypothetical protein [Methylomarinovum caldicuralii]|uniref:Large ribosomal RNA subunit accumulation protein YceD n=2 Tax=Methylomarinovum caldicuralii TaxID=438856 RepID=A0AAU9CWD4_9GAMM|nr:conserved hypothetical protein [Methylomarinovum caldicuralii]